MKNVDLTKKNWGFNQKDIFFSQETLGFLTWCNLFNQEHLGIAEQLVHKLMTKSRIYDCDTQLIAETTLQQFRVSRRMAPRLDSGEVNPDADHESQFPGSKKKQLLGLLEGLLLDKLSNQDQWRTGAESEWHPKAYE